MHLCAEVPLRWTEPPETAGSSGVICPGHRSSVIMRHRATQLHRGAAHTTKPYYLLFLHIPKSRIDSRRRMHIVKSSVWTLRTDWHSALASSGRSLHRAHLPPMTLATTVFGSSLMFDFDRKGIRRCVFSTRLSAQGPTCRRSSTRRSKAGSPAAGHESITAESRHLMEQSFDGTVGCHSRHAARPSWLGVAECTCRSASARPLVGAATNR